MQCARRPKQERNERRGATGLRLSLVEVFLQVGSINLHRRLELAGLELCLGDRFVDIRNATKRAMNSSIPIGDPSPSRAAPVTNTRKLLLAFIIGK
jgi:hypothetical protein